MNPRSLTPASLLVAVVAIIGFSLLWRSSPWQGGPPAPPPVVEHVDPREWLARAEEEARQAVEHYKPKTAGSITDLTAPAVSLLRGLPGVIAVEVLVKADREAGPARW